MANKKKLATSVVAVATAATLLLGGTFAWQSISQTALNEASDVINPGGRLHDDFNGTNKDVYVENFADDDIYARVRLDEYFEITVGSGEPQVIAGQIDENGNKVGETHYFTDADKTKEYWTWATGGSTAYVPTFNKNKDSLQADINGTYNSIDDEGNRYADYEAYDLGDVVNGTEIYDADKNDEDEVGTDFANLETYEGEGAIKTVATSHEVVGTAHAELISMQEWFDLGKPEGNYWVYDEDGWVYYAKPISSGEATGLLLDEIKLNQVMDDSWYYAINVTAQFITADDLGKEDGTGFYQDGQTVSGNALELLKKIGVEIPDEEAVAPRNLQLILNGDGSASVDANVGDYIEISYDFETVDWADIDSLAVGILNEDGSYGAGLSENTDFTYDVYNGHIFVLINEDLVGKTIKVYDGSRNASGTIIVKGIASESSDTAPPILSINDANTMNMYISLSGLTSEDYPITITFHESSDGVTCDYNSTPINTVEVMGVDFVNGSVDYTGRGVGNCYIDGEAITLMYQQSVISEDTYYFGIKVTDAAGNSATSDVYQSKVMIGCFVAGTKVATPNGYVDVEDVKLGDMVYSVNMETGQKEQSSVTWVQEYRITPDTYTIYTADEVIVTTHEHPFYVIGKGWIEAEDLKVGDELESMNGKYSVIKKIEYEKLDVPVQVYNFTVEGNHNYLVTESEILVHNIMK